MSDPVAAVTPILYSFRRCPYAMRARLALVAASTPVQLREVVLRDKPAAFLAASPSATVPCLVDGEVVIDESLDIMVWALERRDPRGLLDMPAAGWDLIAECDGPFKQALDRTKYATRFPDADPVSERSRAAGILARLDAQIESHLFGRQTLADVAILPFVRQFAFIDKRWFDAQEWPRLHSWLDRFLASDAFATMMPKFPQWQAGDPPVIFPEASFQPM